MGYSVWYNLEVLDVNKEKEEEIKKAFEESAIEDATYILEGEEVRNWYTQDEDMIEFSKKFPDAILELEGQGEHSEHMWKSRYKNGEYDLINWIWPPFEKIKTKHEQTKEQTSREVQK